MVLRFGPFELDAGREELRRSGLVLRLPRQPARLLLMLVRRAGEVVTREEMRQELWGSDTHVDYEQGINAAIRQIRFHLGDNADVPRYVKTLPRRGYVWIAPVERADALPEPEIPVAPVVMPSRPAPKRAPLVPLAAVAVIALAAVALWIVFHRHPRTIAVLPFRAIGALPSGIDSRAFTQELRATVGALPREHVMLLEESSNDDAAVRIEGTIQRAGDSVRVIVSGIDTASGTQLWTETYVRRMGDHHNLAMQTAHLVAHEVVRRFLPPPQREPPLRTQVPPRVLEMYRRARIESHRSLPDPRVNHAAELFEQVLREEPQFPEAMSGLADIWAQRLSGAPASRPLAAARAREYASRALALQPRNAEAQSTLGLLALQSDWNLSAAEEAFRKAIDDDPKYVDVHYNLCSVLTARGEFDAALEEYERARALDPIDYDLHPAEGVIYLRARRYEEAIAKYRETLRFRDSVISRWGILWTASKRRDWNEATAMLRQMLELPPRPPGAAATESEFRELLRRIEPTVLTYRDRGTFDDYNVAAYYSERGDPDLAFAELNRAVRNRSPILYYLLVDPRFDAIRDDPRYPAIARRIR